MKKQDLNGVRTPEDVERRYKLGAISGLESDVDELKQDVIVDDFLSSTSIHPVQNKIITAALGSLNSSKVDKVSGKGLSSNDFTDTYKSNVDSNTTARHSHSNKTLLDSLTDGDIYTWDHKATLNDVYPVGSVYSTVDSTFSPGTSFGGTWTSVGTQTVGSDTIYLYKRV